MSILPPIVFFLCLATSVLCMVLLVRGCLQTRAPLLLWSSLCFVGLALNNLFLVVDLVLFPSIDFFPARQAASLVAVAVLLYGFIWETD
jgi:hypothetical protein